MGCEDEFSKSFGLNRLLWKTPKSITLKVTIETRPLLSILWTQAVATTTTTDIQSFSGLALREISLHQELQFTKILPTLMKTEALDHTPTTLRTSQATGHLPTELSWHRQTGKSFHTPFFVFCGICRTNKSISVLDKSQSKVGTCAIPFFPILLELVCRTMASFKHRTVLLPCTLETLVSLQLWMSTDHRLLSTRLWKPSLTRRVRPFSCCSLRI